MKQRFAKAILAWFDIYGRKDLPWQKPQEPYRIWVSEIMLQQTQVNTVIGYFQRFIQRFPTIKALAESDLDLVLSHWAGLGYYARARNLHRAAQIIQHHYHGVFPQEIALLQQLPGIGRSTAGAILALGYGKKAAILDGNVKRVLTRYHAQSGWPGDPRVMAKLWKLAEYYTPDEKVAEYTQAMMDLGATVCTRSQPRCQMCPISAGCQAYALQQQHLYPTAKPKKDLPIRQTYFLLLINPKGDILLEKRPPSGIWGSLWSLPECPPQEDIAAWCEKHYCLKIGNISHWPSFRHTFSHFHLDIKPLVIPVTGNRLQIRENNQQIWYKPQATADYAFAAPIKRLIQFYKEQSHGKANRMRQVKEKSRRA